MGNLTSGLVQKSDISFNTCGDTMPTQDADSTTKAFGFADDNQDEQNSFAQILSALTGCNEHDDAIIQLNTLMSDPENSDMILNTLCQIAYTKLTPHIATPSNGALVLAGLSCRGADPDSGGAVEDSS
jgi:hypothetical protein